MLDDNCLRVMFGTKLPRNGSSCTGTFSTNDHHIGNNNGSWSRLVEKLTGLESTHDLTLFCT